MKKIDDISNINPHLNSTHMQFSNINPESLLRIEGDVWVFWKNVDGVYLGCNQCMANHLMLSSPQEIIGKTDYDLPILKSEADYYRSCDQTITENGISRQFYDTATIPGGKRLCLVIKIPLFGDDKNIAGLAGFSYGLEQKINTLTTDDKGKFSFNDAINKLSLTKRETECLYYLARGKNTKEVASLLKISPRTVEYFTVQLKTKLGVKSKSELIEKIIDNYL